MTTRRYGYVHRTGVQLVLCVLLSLTSAHALSATAISDGSIDRIYTYGDGRVLVTGIVFPTGTC